MSLERRITELEARAPASNRQRVIIVAEGDTDAGKAASIAARGPLQPGEEWMVITLVSGKPKEPCHGIA